MLSYLSLCPSRRRRRAPCAHKEALASKCSRTPVFVSVRRRSQVGDFQHFQSSFILYVQANLDTIPTTTTTGIAYNATAMTAVIVGLTLHHSTIVLGGCFSGEYKYVCESTIEHRFKTKLLESSEPQVRLSKCSR